MATTPKTVSVELSADDLAALIAGLNARDSHLIAALAHAGPAGMDALTADLKASRALGDKLIAAQRVARDA